KIFKITCADPQAPQPMIAWPASPTEVRVAFDKPLDPSVTNAFSAGQVSRRPNPSRDTTSRSANSQSADRIPPSETGDTPALPCIEYGEYVRAGDRYEVLKPPYRVVQNQEATPRGKLKIVAAKLERDGQTLVLTTDPHPLAV